MASCSLACSSSSLFISSSSIGLGELVADLVEARDLRERAAQAFHDDAAHVLVRIELRVPAAGSRP